MTRSRFDPRLEDYEDPDEAVMSNFWQAYWADQAIEPHEGNPACSGSSFHAHNAFNRHREDDGQLTSDWDKLDQAAQAEDQVRRGPHA